MSHTTRITGVLMTDPDARAAAALAMGMVPPTRETVRLYDGSAHEGTALRLPGWQYPMVIKDDGTAVLDNYNGRWGSMDVFDQFCQQYTLAVAMYDQEYRTEVLENGDLRVYSTQ